MPPHGGSVDAEPTAPAIVDGIVGMEGDGTILGTRRHVGAVVVGRNPPAHDAQDEPRLRAIRDLMGIKPIGQGDSVRPGHRFAICGGLTLERLLGAGPGRQKKIVCESERWVDISR